MNARLGIYLKILSALCATLMLACVKGLQGAIPTGEVIFFRSFIAMFPLLIWLKIQGNVLASIKTKNIFGHLIRGFSGTGGMYFNYLALVSISLADATALSYAAPLFTVIMAALLLKERVRFSRWLGGYRRFFRHSVYALRQFNRQRFSVRWRPSAVRDGSRRRVRPACRSLHRHLQHSDPFSQRH